MKIIALGDTHGRTAWKGIVSNTEFDKVVFTGDYFDSREYISPEQQKANFKEIIAFKKANMNKVVLLFGNHEYHYMKTKEGIYSGYQFFHSEDFKKMVQNALAEKLIQMCYVHGKFIFSHAGITKTWLKSTGYSGEENLESFINALFYSNPQAFKFTRGKNQSNNGNDICQSPIWVRPGSLYKDAIENYTQVAGHTEQIGIDINEVATLIDTLGTSGQYLEIKDGIMAVKEKDILVKKNSI